MIAIAQIQFGDDGLRIEYTDTDDIRVGGKVAISKLATIDLSHPDYGEDAALLEAQANRLLRNALEDWRDSPPALEQDSTDAVKAADDDDDPGMGWGR